jgi:hypothetical protein
MFFLFLAMVASSAAESTSARSTPLEAAYFADRVGPPIQPLTGSIDFSNGEFMVVQTPDGALQIAYRDIRSLSYCRAAVSVFQPESGVFHDLLTIGFDAGNGVHHNLVVQLDPKGRGETLKTITSRTGIKVGMPSENSRKQRE